jgi:hypothetical protein
MVQGTKKMDYGVRERLKSITPHNGNIDKDKISFIYALMNPFDNSRQLSTRIN